MGKVAGGSGGKRNTGEKWTEPTKRNSRREDAPRGVVTNMLGSSLLIFA